MKEKRIDRGNILAEGEATGHTHRVSVQVMEREDGIREFEGATTVIHEEHDPITLPTRKWLSGQKTEYDYYADMEHQVVD